MPPAKCESHERRRTTCGPAISLPSFGLPATITDTTPPNFSSSADLEHTGFHPGHPFVQNDAVSPVDFCLFHVALQH